MHNLRQLYRPIRSVLNGKRRVLKIALVLGITLYVLTDSIRTNNNVVNFRHRVLCSYTMHRGGGGYLQLRSLYSESGCATIWPEGTGDMVPWEDNYPPKTHLARIADPQPKTDIGFVVLYENCPESANTGTESANTDHDTNTAQDGIESPNTPDDGTDPTNTSENDTGSTSSLGSALGSTYVDTAAVLKHAVACSIPSGSTTFATPVASSSSGAVVNDPGATENDSGTTENDSGNNSDSSTSSSVNTVVSAPAEPTIYALMHPDAVTCKSETGEDYDRATVMQRLGYWVKIWDSPVDENNLKNQPYIAENIENDVGLKDLMKLQALKLAEHEFVVVMDQNYILKKPLDHVFEDLRESGDIAAYLRDPDTGAISNDVLVLKPSEETLDDLVHTFTNEPYTENGGWGNSGIGLYPGGMGTSGLLDYFMNDPEPQTGMALRTGIELDRCTYDNNADGVCNTKPYEDVVGYTMSDDICGQPWMCTYGTLEESWDEDTRIMCKTFLTHWVQAREEFEALWTSPAAERSGDEHAEIYHGLCTAQGPEGYIPLLARVAPEIENCVGGSLEFYGCDANFVSNPKTALGSRSQLEVIVSSPQQCDVFVALPNNGGAVIPFSGVVEISGTGLADTSMVFVIDRSGSTCDVVNLGCSSDENYDLQYDDVLDCEIAAILDLVSKVREEGSVSHVGLVSFSHKVENIISATIELPLTDIHLFDPGQAHAIENAIRDVRCGGATNYAAAVEKACEVIDQSSTENNVVVFMSDGEPTRGGTPAAYCNNNAVFHTIALGQYSTCDGGDDTSLTAIAQATAGTCQQVPQIADIRPILKEIGESRVTSLKGSTIASESSVNFGCSDIPNFSNSINLGCDYFTEPKCGTNLSGLEYQNILGETGDSACCACGGGVYVEVGDLAQSEDTTLINPNFIPDKNSFEVVAYSDAAIMHPGSHTVCATAIGSDGGVPGANVQCRKVLVCPNPVDYDDIRKA